MKKTGLFENGLIWFGAAVSIAEILTGTYFAPLGFKKGLLTFMNGFCNLYLTIIRGTPVWVLLLVGARQ